jgi:hypothetical protein
VNFTRRGTAAPIPSPDGATSVRIGSRAPRLASPRTRVSRVAELAPGRGPFGRKRAGGTVRSAPSGGGDAPRISPRRTGSHRVRNVTTPARARARHASSPAARRARWAETRRRRRPSGSPVRCAAGDCVGLSWRREASPGTRRSARFQPAPGQKFARASRERAHGDPSGHGSLPRCSRILRQSVLAAPLA